MTTAAGYAARTTATANAIQIQNQQHHAGISAKPAGVPLATKAHTTEAGEPRVPLPQRRWDTAVSSA